MLTRSVPGTPLGIIRLDGLILTLSDTAPVLYFGSLLGAVDAAVIEAFPATIRDLSRVIAPLNRHLGRNLHHAWRAVRDTNRGRLFLRRIDLDRE